MTELKMTKSEASFTNIIISHLSVSTNKGTKYEQETFFVKDPNENILEIKTLTANAE